MNWKKLRELSMPFLLGSSISLTFIDIQITLLVIILMFGLLMISVMRNSTIITRMDKTEERAFNRFSKSIQELELLSHRLGMDTEDLR